MKEIRLGRKLGAMRREKGITQEELASYFGVSKASVSKWETGQSYPDILLLPQLAAYFHITVDELLGYEPQMDKADIRRLYRRLAEDFSQRPFREVLEEVEDLARDYYSCFPLLVQLGGLLLNHADLAQGPEQAQALELAVRLCLRVKEESGDMELMRRANVLEAASRLSLGQTEQAASRLEHTGLRPDLGEESLYAAVLQKLGDMPKARQVLQLSLYQHLMGMLSVFPLYLMMLDDPEKFREGMRRAQELCVSFRVDGLHPYLEAQLEFVCGYCCIQQGEREACLDHLRRYVEACRKAVPASLHGDDFFDRVEPWIEELDLGEAAPRMDRHFRRGLAEAVTKNPVFSPLSGEPKFHSVCELLEQLVAEGEPEKDKCSEKRE